MIRILIMILLDILNLWMEKSIEIGMLYMLVYIITMEHYHSIVYNVYSFIPLK